MAEKRGFVIASASQRVAALLLCANVSRAQQKPGGWITPAAGFQLRTIGALEHAQHDRADKGECEIRGHHA
jgi:hypothetical protein